MAAKTKRPIRPKRWSDRTVPIDPPGRLEAWLWMAAIFVAAWALYAWSAPRTVVLEDDGEFISVVYRMGVAHAPGYPLFVLLAKPFTWLPVGSVAFRVHLASGCFAAAACSVLWWIGRALTGRAEAAAVAAAAYAVSREFWSQAIIADVYSLNVLLVFVALALALGYADRPRPPLALGLVLVTALGLSNHWPLFLLASPCVLLPLLPVRRRLSADLGSRPVATAAVLLAGLLPYVWLVIRSQTAPLLSFSGPIDSFGGFWTFVSRAGYSTLENNPNAGFSEKLGFLGFTAREALWQYTPAGAIIAAVGAVIQWRRTKAPLAAGLAIASLSATVLLIALIRWDDDFLWRTVFSVYPLVAYGIGGVWLAYGLTALQDAGSARAGRAGRQIVTAAALALPAVIWTMNVARNDRHADTYAADFATTMLDGFAPDAVVFTHSDVDINTLFYYHFVEGKRPDIRLLTDSGLGMTSDAGRLFDPIRTTPAERARLVATFARTSDRPVYFFGLAPNTLSDVDYGLYRRIDRGAGAEAVSTFGFDRALIDYFRRVADRRPTDAWTIDHRHLVFQQMGYALSGLVELGGQGYRGYRPDLERASEEFSGLLGRLILLNRLNALGPDQLLAIIQKAEGLLDDTINTRDRAALAGVRASVMSKMGKKD